MSAKNTAYETLDNHSVTKIDNYTPRINDSITKQQIFGAIIVIAAEISAAIYLLLSYTSGKPWNTTQSIILGMAVLFALLALLSLLGLNKHLREFIKKQSDFIFGVLFVAIAAGVAIGESAAAGNFIKESLQTKHLLGLTINDNAITIVTNITLVSAFILSMALFYMGMEDTKKNFLPICYIIWYGNEEGLKNINSEDDVVKYTILQRILLSASVIAAAAAAFVCGALSYNSMLSLHASSFQAMLVWGLDLFAYTCVFTVYFVIELKKLFKIYNEQNSNNSGLLNLLKAIQEQNSKVGGVNPEVSSENQKQNRVKQVSFWSLFVVLSIAVSVISYALFYGQVTDFSMQIGGFSVSNISPSYAHAITAIAMIVDFAFRWKSIWMILDYALNKFSRAKTNKGKDHEEENTQNQTSSTAKKKGAIILLWVVLGILPSVINGIGQGAGTFYAEDILPKWLSHDTMLGLYFFSLLLGSAGANAFSVLEIIQKIKPQKIINKIKQCFFVKPENKEEFSVKTKQDGQRIMLDDMASPYSNAIN